MRDRLIELLCNVKCEGEECFGNCPYRIGQRCNKVQRLEMCSVFAIADSLLADGVIVPPVKLGSRHNIYYPVKWTNTVYETKVYGIGVDEYGDMTINPTEYPEEVIEFRGVTLGKDVFLTREEAEKAIEERREG